MDYVQESFDAFLRERCDRYRFGRGFYPKGALVGDQFCQNPYIKTEADFQMKFGCFLEQFLHDRDPELVVHAEMPIYADPRARADLTIHRVPDGSNWEYKEKILGSLLSVIEVKLANVREPLYDFFKGDGVKKDLIRLKSLGSEINRYLLIADEGEAIDPLQIQQFLSDAEEHDVVVLSNNAALMGAA